MKTKKSYVKEMTKKEKNRVRKYYTLSCQENTMKSKRKQIREMKKKDKKANYEEENFHIAKVTKKTK